MKILKESKTQLPITYLTNFVSRGWGEVGNLKEELEAIRHEFKDVKKIEDCVSDLIDAYLICIGTLESMLDDKKYVEFPEEMKESLTENFEIELDKAEDEEAENEEKDIFDFEDKSVDEIATFLIKDEQEAIAGYKAAAKAVSKSESAETNEVLAVLDHIEKEEEEHIEELEDLVGNFEIADKSAKKADDFEPFEYFVDFEDLF